MKRLLLKLDILPQVPKLLFRSEKNHPTIIGLITSLIFYSIAGFCIFLFGKEMIERKFPSSSVQTTELQIPPIIGIDPFRMPIAFNLFNYDTNELIDSQGLFSFEIQFSHSQRVWNDTSKLYQFSVTTETIQPEVCETGQHIMMPAISCVFLLTISYFLAEISFWLKYCQESDSTSNGDKQNCLAKEIIDQRLKTANIAIVTPQLNLDLSSQDIVQYFAQLQYTATSIKFAQNIQMYFKQINLLVDHGIFMDDIETQQVFTSSNYRQYQDNLGDNFLLRIQLSSEQHMETITVRYQKLQEVIAEIGGFLNITLIFLGFLASRFIEIDFYFTLIKENMNLLTTSNELIQETQRQLINSPSKKEIQPELQIELVKPEQTKFPFSEIVSLDQDNYDQKVIATPAPSQKRIQQINKIYQDYQISTFDQIQIGLCMAKQKLGKFYQQGQRDIDDKISIEKLLKMMHELEILKFLILDPQQYMLFHTQFQKQNLIIQKDLRKNQLSENSNQSTEMLEFYEQMMLEKLSKFVYINELDSNRTGIFKNSQDYQESNQKLNSFQQRFGFYLDHVPNIQRVDHENSEKKNFSTKVSPLDGSQK